MRVRHTGAGTVVQTRALPPGSYVVEASASNVGPFRPIGAVRASGFGIREIRLPANETRYVRLRAVADPPARP